jgi:hypothetical protein
MVTWRASRGGGGRGVEGRAGLEGRWLGEEAGGDREEGDRPCYRGDFSHPRWPWLLRGVDEESGAQGTGGATSQQQDAPQPK